jgi:hypothetical protein
MNVPPGKVRRCGFVVSWLLISVGIHLCEEKGDFKKKSKFQMMGVKGRTVDGCTARGSFACVI